jgi:hypothetical protein
MLRRTSLLTAIFTFMIAGTAFAQPFKAEDVERAKTFWVGNATGTITPHKDCLETVNEAMRLLFNDRDMRLGSTVDLTMNALRKRGRALPARVHEFKDAKGRNTIGVTEPETLRESVWDALIAHTKGVPGWHLFGLSPLDGIHSVILALDFNDPTAPQVFWADQWSTKGGWKLYPTKEDLDGEIEYRTNSWWKGELPKKFKSRCTLYPLIPRNPAEPKTDEFASLSRTPYLYYRSKPTTSGNKPLGSLSRAAAKEFRVLARQGAWLQIDLGQGKLAWVHGAYMKIRKVIREVEAPDVGAATVLSQIGG